MELERTTALYFSPAGGTKKVTERIAQSVGPRAESADVTVRARELEFGPAELVVIGAPVYGGRVPWPVGERLSRVSARGTPAVIAAVYGNRAYEDALLELRTLAEGRGFRVMAAGAFIARHSIVPEVAQGRPDAEDLVKIDEFSRRIRERLEYVASAESLPTAISSVHEVTPAAAATATIPPNINLCIFIIVVRYFIDVQLLSES